jgi:hypothetical protein
MHGHHHRRHGGFRGFGRRRFPSSDDLLQMLEEHQRDLEQEVADVAELVRRLREGGQPAPTPAI